jgi:hypothetical protein
MNCTFQAIIGLYDEGEAAARRRADWHNASTGSTARPGHGTIKSINIRDYYDYVTLVDWVFIPPNLHAVTKFSIRLQMAPVIFFCKTQRSE